MKGHSSKAPNLETYLELNTKFGHGYQARMVMEGVKTSVIDDQPYTLEEITAGVGEALAEINRATGYSYKPHEVIRITDEAIQANKKRELATARLARDIERGKGEMTVPYRQEMTTKVIDGEDEVVFTGRGTILVVYYSWVNDKMPKAREGLERYCQYLAMHGYGGSGTDILTELDSMAGERGANWIRATYEKYVTDDLALIGYVLHGGRA